MTDYQVVSTGSYDEGRIVTSILLGKDLIKSVISREDEKKREGWPLWLTYVWDGRLEEIEKRFQGYIVNMGTDLIPKIENGKLMSGTRQHEDIVETLLEDLVKK
ncbi:hypothetical protein GOV03_04225 [Candidatus Woesearchaeota archaeon]|nr:hypothetical protein [Candidatus Woesearchaeota archaeon]